MAKIIVTYKLNKVKTLDEEAKLRYMALMEEHLLSNILPHIRFKKVENKKEVKTNSGPGFFDFFKYSKGEDSRVKRSWKEAKWHIFHTLYSRSEGEEEGETRDYFWYVIKLPTYSSLCLSLFHTLPIMLVTSIKFFGSPTRFKRVEDSKNTYSEYTWKLNPKYTDRIPYFTHIITNLSYSDHEGEVLSDQMLYQFWCLIHFRKHYCYTYRLKLRKKLKPE